ncbi:glycine zipper family protein [Flavobacterium suncheonense]|nr:glycine zipper family protein [Flavobacterium suncheonense]
MKKLAYTFLLTLTFTIISFGQENNPYNQRGIDLANTYKILIEDIRNGKIKSVDQETLDYYTLKTPIKTKVSLESVTDIISQLNGQKPEEKLKNLSLSNYSKEILLKVGENKTELIKLVDQVKASKINPEEKEFLLTTLAFTYNRGNNDGFWGALAGAGIGYLICNVPCSVVGAVIGAVWGEIGK